MVGEVRNWSQRGDVNPQSSTEQKFFHNLRRKVEDAKDAQHPEALPKGFKSQLAA
jgi:hypothetical protein